MKKKLVNRCIYSLRPSSFILHPSMGFTLVEMLVVVALMSILVVIGSNVFVSILRSNNKSLILTQVREEGSKALDVMSRSFQNASDVVYPDASTTTCQKYIIVKNKTTGTSYGNSVGQKAYTRIGFESGTALTDGNGYIALSSADTPGELNTAGTPITNTTGTAAVNVNYDNNATPTPPINGACFTVRRLSASAATTTSIVIAVNFTITESAKVKASSPNRNEYVARTDFQTAYTVRSY